MVKGVGIILVVAGHSTLVSDEALTWLASFHMPLFFIVSGMILQHTKEEEKTIREIAIRKLRSIMIPYGVFSVISTVIPIAYQLLKGKHIVVREILEHIVQTLSLDGISVLWFLPALFVGELFFLFLRKKTGRGMTAGVVSLLAVFVFSAAPSGRTDLFSMWTGGVVRMAFRSAAACVFLGAGYYTNCFLKEREDRSGREIAAGIACFLLHLCIYRRNGRVDLNFLAFGNPVLYLLNAYLGTMAVVLLCKNCRPLRLLTYAGKNSLVIMATHMDCQVLAFALKISAYLVPDISGMKKYAYDLAAAISICLMEAAVIYIFNHYLYVLLGKKRE